MTDAQVFLPSNGVIFRPLGLKSLLLQGRINLILIRLPDKGPLSIPNSRNGVTARSGDIHSRSRQLQAQRGNPVIEVLIELPSIAEVFIELPSIAEVLIELPSTAAESHRLADRERATFP